MYTALANILLKHFPGIVENFGDQWRIQEKSRFPDYFGESLSMGIFSRLRENVLNLGKYLAVASNHRND